MSESSILQELKSCLESLNTVFSPGDVTINDWSVLDGSSLNAPYAIIESCDDFSLDSPQSRSSLIWDIPVHLIVRFENWNISKPALSSLRQSILDKFLDLESFSSSMSKLAVGFRRLWPAGPISGIYDRYLENEQEALPVYLSQTILIRVHEII